MPAESSQLRQEVRYGVQENGKLQFANATHALQMKESKSISDKIETTDDTMMTIANASGDITTEGQFQPSEGESTWVHTRPNNKATSPEDIILSAIYDGVDIPATTGDGAVPAHIMYLPGPITPKLHTCQIVSPNKLQVALGTVFSGEEFEVGTSQGLIEHKTKKMFSRAFDFEFAKVLSITESTEPSGNTVVTLEIPVGTQIAAFETGLTATTGFNEAKNLAYGFYAGSERVATRDLNALSNPSQLLDFGTTLSAGTAETSEDAGDEVRPVATYINGSAVIIIPGAPSDNDIEVGDYFAPVDTGSSLIRSSSYFQQNHSNLELRINFRVGGTEITSRTDLLAMAPISYFDKFSYNFQNGIEFRGGFVGSSKTLDPFYTDTSNVVEGEIMLPLIASNAHLKSALVGSNVMDIHLTIKTGDNSLVYYVPDVHRKELSSEIGSAYDGLTIPWRAQGLGKTQLLEIRKS